MENRVEGHGFARQRHVTKSSQSEVEKIEEIETRRIEILSTSKVKLNRQIVRNKIFHNKGGSVVAWDT